MRLFCTLCFLALAGYATARAGCGCEPIGTLVNGRHDTVSTVAELRASLASQASPLEIYLRPGDYPIDAPLLLDRPGIIVRSLDEDRTTVTIRGGGAGEFPGFVVTESNVTIADLTIRDISGMAVAVLPTKTAANIVIHNVDFFDADEGFVRMTSPASATLGNCFVECCTFKYGPPPARPGRTPGVEADAVSNLFIRECRFINIVAGVPGGGAAVVVHGASRNVSIERCRFFDGDMGITIGDSADLSNTVQGGMIRGNFIKGHPASGSAISIFGAQAITIDHNTIYSPGGVPRSIDVRFPQSLGNGATDNLLDEVIEQRDGVFGLFTEGNIEHAGASNFRNASIGDLHLVAGSPAIDAAANGQEEDIDCDPLIDGHPDVGADEYRAPSGIGPTVSDRPLDIDYDATANAIVLRGCGDHAIDLKVVDMMGRTVANIRAGADGHVPLPALSRGPYLIVTRGNGRTPGCGKMMVVGRQ